MNNYEIMFILDPKEESTSAKDQLKELFKEHGAQILEEQELGLKKLAYPIQKKDRGIYFLMKISLDSQKNELLKRELNLKEFVLRYMFVKLG